MFQHLEILGSKDYYVKSRQEINHILDRSLNQLKQMTGSLVSINQSASAVKITVVNRKKEDINSKPLTFFCCGYVNTKVNE